MIDKTVSFKEQLALLKHATVLTGGIHEAQALQLRNYPLVIEGVKKATLKIDTDKKIVYYDIKVDRTFKSQELFKKTCQAITQWIRSIVWDDTSVVFTKNKEVLYDTRNS